MASTNSNQGKPSPDSFRHETYMRRAIELARNGSGNVSPNPLVGCVIVYEGRIIGEGWHKQYGGPHAEVNAIATVKDPGILKDSTVYVNLEPCSHTGKTPPCVDLLIHHQVRQVVVANQDPNPVVSGTGIQKLREAGIGVIKDILAAEGYQVNKRFFTFMQKKRPHIILKWAQTSDGFIARENFDSKWISDAYSRQLVHKWRTEEDAILVSSRTAWHDNPILDARNWTGRNPVRIVVDRYLKLGNNQHLFDGTQMTICYNLIKNESRQNLHYVMIPEENTLDSIMKHLFAEKIQSVIVEGGARMLQSFVDAKLWDEARIFVSPKTFGKGIAAPIVTGKLVHQVKLAEDWMKLVEPIR